MTFLLRRSRGQGEGCDFMIALSLLLVKYLLTQNLRHVDAAFGRQLSPPWEGRYSDTLGVSRCPRNEYRPSSSRVSLTFNGHIFASGSSRNDDDDRIDNEGSKNPGESSDSDIAEAQGNSGIFSADSSLDRENVSSYRTNTTRNEAVLEILPERHLINGAEYEKSSVRSMLPKLWQLTRPENFPGIIVFHLLGSYLAIRSLGGDGGMAFSNKLYWKLMLTHPAMWLTLISLMLTSSTSMVVNDYYDAKLGRDMIGKGLAGSDLPLYVARRFLSYLYAAALVCVALLPGALTRLSVVTGLMLTYLYTQHLKPITWIKNAVCASLIALSPLTSGSAALTLMSLLPQHSAISPKSYLMPTVWRLVGTLFFGIMGREMLMDCNDVEADQLAGVRTVPAVHGRRFASRIAFGCSGLMAAAAFGGPVYELLLVFLEQRMKSATETSISIFSLVFSRKNSGIARRLGFASLGSIMALRRNWKVARTGGMDEEAIAETVQEGLVTVLVLLLSFV